MAAVDRRLVEQLVEGDCVASAEVLGDGPPELERFLLRRVVHRVLEQFHLQVADAVPVDDDVHAQLGAPLDRLVEQLDVLGRRPFPPGHGVDRDANDHRAEFFDVLEVGLVPMPLVLDLVGVGDRQPAKQDRVAVRVDELVAFHGDQGQLPGVGASERPAEGLIAPPLMVAGGL